MKNKYRIIERDYDVYEYELLEFKTLKEAESKLYDILLKHYGEYSAECKSEPIITSYEDSTGSVYRIDYICKYTKLPRVKEFIITDISKNDCKASDQKVYGIYDSIRKEKGGYINDKGM